MDNLIQDYTYLFDEFDESRVSDRCTWLNDMLNSFIKINNLSEIVHVSEEVLYHVILDYFADIERLKRFQNIKKTNTIKIFSYLTYWILRHKPIQIYGAISDKDVFVNEKFCRELIRMYLFDNPDNVPIKKDKTEAITDFIETLYYYFKYRDVNPQCIELMLLAFEAGRGYQFSVDYQK